MKHPAIPGLIGILCLLFGVPGFAGAGERVSPPPALAHADIFEGLIWVEGGRTYLITNYKSRSRVDYEITGELKPRLTALDGQLVTVAGTAVRQGWSGTIEVTRILRPKKIPPEHKSSQRVKSPLSKGE